jgi:hypothetical protein
VGERRDAYRALVGSSEGKRRLGRPRLRWEGNIKMTQKKWDGVVDWIDLAQNRDK